MKKLIVTDWISLDGFIAGPDGEIDFLRVDEDMSRYELGLVEGTDSLMFGRKTYQDFANHWPKVPEMADADDFNKAYAAKVNPLGKIVFSRTLSTPLWNDTRFFGEITRESVAEAKAGDGTMVMYGSASVAGQISALGMVDEYHLLMHPVVLGSGVRLLDKVGTRTELKLGRLETFGSGVVLMVYRRG